MKVNGQTRPQAALIDLSTTPATLADWETDRYVPPCFSTRVRHLHARCRLLSRRVVLRDRRDRWTACRNAVRHGGRWNTNATGSGLQPAWVDVTGGDTLSAVAITGPVVYIGRPPALDEQLLRERLAGPGAVSRPGSPRSIPPTACRSPGTRRRIVAWPCSPCTRRTMGCGWAATRTTLPASYAGGSPSSRSPAVRSRRRPIRTHCPAISTTSPPHRARAWTRRSSSG